MSPLKKMIMTSKPSHDVRAPPPTIAKQEEGQMQSLIMKIKSKQKKKKKKNIQQDLMLLQTLSCYFK